MGMVGILSILTGVYHLFQVTDWPVFLILLLFVILVDFIPTKMPSGHLYSFATIPILYMDLKVAAGTGVTVILVSTAAIYFIKAKSFNAVNAYKFLATNGMYLISYLSSVLVMKGLAELPVIVMISAGIVVYETVNLFLLGCILQSVNRISVRHTLWSNRLNLIVSCLICSLVLYRLFLQPSHYDLLMEMLYASLFMVIINLFSAAYSKQLFAMEESNQRYRSLFDYHPDLVCTLDRKGNFVSANPMFEKLLGYTPEEFMKLNLSLMYDRPGSDYIREAYERVMTGKPQEFTMMAKHKNGDSRELFVSSSPIVVDHAVVGVYAIAKDITENKEYERIIYRMAYYDAVTGLPNRTLFKERLQQAIQESAAAGRAAGVLFLDMDQFKTINDTLGHYTGDLLLVEVARRLEASLPAPSTVSRLGGDEFTVILPLLERPEDSVRAAETILEAFTNPFTVGEHELFLTPSIGISLYPDDGQDVDSLIKMADASMYKVKENGGNHYELYTTALKEANEERLTLHTNLRRALERKEFYLEYQPKLNLKTGEVYGMEALLRWENEELGKVSPDRFIPVAEDSKQILPIGEWVLREACTRNRRWQDSGMTPLTVSVNISTIQFQQGDFVRTVDRILKETGLAPEWLELEITESLLLRSSKKNMDLLYDLKALGISLSIDDFGIGYSSLSYLNHFPIDYLKIDRSFISQIHSESKDENIIKTIIRLAHNLNMKVVAEGVETAEQLAFLSRLSCDGIQGYLLSRPLPAEEIMKRAWLETAGNWQEVWKKTAVPEGA
ncbi:EAL domain-containing protein [Paenibacillus aurantius]|uniref:EAL domain-containing protein n=1 Tax=Paenibacillus aurantius TaxID=2918900 RepID=A0AA96LKM5_9BACL|nr:EAL domain-containing protein [Paenibacillus aurantius]WNQ13816.1 EAL domain-containing protein [Paenibacillus aurantius]